MSNKMDKPIVAGASRRAGRTTTRRLGFTTVSPLPADTSGQATGLARRNAIPIVAEATNPEPARRAQMSPAARGQRDTLPQPVSDSWVRTAREWAGFCEAGGMINFVIADRRVHFHINNQAREAAESKISSKLPKLARQRPRKL